MKVFAEQPGWHRKFERLHRDRTFGVTVKVPVLKLLLICQSLVGLDEVIPALLSLLFRDSLRVHCVGVVLPGELPISILNLLCVEAAVVLDVEELVGVELLTRFPGCQLFDEDVRVSPPLAHEREENDFDEPAHLRDSFPSVLVDALENEEREACKEPTDLESEEDV